MEGPQLPRQCGPNPDFSLLGMRPNLPPSHPPPSLPPPPPGHLEMPTVDGAAAAFARRYAALRLSVSCPFCMYSSVPSSIRGNHLPVFLAASHHPSNFILKTGISSLRLSIQSFSCPPEKPLLPTSSPDITLCGRCSSPIRAANPAKQNSPFAHYCRYALGSRLGNSVGVR